MFCAMLQGEIVQVINDQARRINLCNPNFMTCQQEKKNNFALCKHRLCGGHYPLLTGRSCCAKGVVPYALACRAPTKKDLVADKTATRSFFVLLCC
jgi:hypothetical protein